mgnify:CR=1
SSRKSASGASCERSGAICEWCELAKKCERCELRAKRCDL